MSKPRLLDLFCGAGGAAMGYARAGFEVVGVDIKPQPRFPFEFIQADALEVLSDVQAAPGSVVGVRGLGSFDAIHASPPCQAYTPMSNRWRVSGKAQREHPRLIEPTRDRLLETGLPFVIENVQGAPVRPDVKLCGFPFGLRVHRHRLFETSALILGQPLTCRGWSDHVGVYGDHPDGGRFWTRKDGHKPLRRAASIEEGSVAMGIDWMTWPELKEAIPPAFTEYIGRQLLTSLELSA